MKKTYNYKIENQKLFLQKVKTLFGFPLVSKNESPWNFVRVYGREYEEFETYIIANPFLYNNNEIGDREYGKRINLIKL